MSSGIPKKIRKEIHERYKKTGYFLVVQDGGGGHDVFAGMQNDAMLINTLFEVARIGKIVGKGPDFYAKVIKMAYENESPQNRTEEETDEELK